MCINQGQFLQENFSIQRNNEQQSLNNSSLLSQKVALAIIDQKEISVLLPQKLSQNLLENNDFSE